VRCGQTLCTNFVCPCLRRRLLQVSTEVQIVSQVAQTNVAALATVFQDVFKQPMPIVNAQEQDVQGTSWDSVNGAPAPAAPDNTGLIAGAAVGAIVVLGIIGGALYYKYGTTPQTKTNSGLSFRYVKLS